MYKKIAIIIIILAVLGVGVLAYQQSHKTTLKIYCAGSLAKPLTDAAKEFENRNPDVKIEIESHGSAEAIRQITDLKKPGDIVAVADYDLIDKRMIPKYATWNIQFARNELVIAYTDKSKYKNEINGENWYQIFQRPDVKYGFSNPNLDPCGYRAVMMIQLANKYYNNDTIFENLIAKHTSITSVANDSGYVVYAPSDLKPDKKVMIRPKEVDLVSALESGQIDYLIIYKSVAMQHKLKYVELPEKLNLKSTKYEKEYKKISLVQYADTKKQVVKLKPIVYGITVVNNSKHKDLAEKFVQFLLSKDGQEVLKRNYQEPIVPAVSTVDISKIPPLLRNFVVPKK